MDQSPFEAAPGPAPAGLTPMMAQFFEIKAVNPGYLLFYRMGDFYELFFEDAEIASAALGIVLTKRGKHLGEDIQMCGVPIHAANDYLNKLIRLGHRVAICEQMEDPAEAKKRGSKSVVRRDVVRLVTPGTLTEDDHLDARSANYLAALAMVRHGETDFALAWADISTGETFVSDLAADQLGDEMARIAPAELLLTDATRAALVERHLFAPAWSGIASTITPDLADSEAAMPLLRSSFPSEAFDPSALSRAGRAALGALVGYVGESQKGRSAPLRPPLTNAA
ncbi:MAG: DNA mismatch repair protein MutS, partial [Hyphomonas sp.]|nr:DNA mismatch repair protein MutS [Hyphomonas sp.]